ncbi:hypothetical protein SAMD00019534_114880 [Acytostelium subglobosum LB1]|uniref:hypothetical protein n=1 Tax=Acytostelium subglobosum LB1 TaxID=1410327 RepID=UPI0006447CAF|nr:hypothetical protein SAMD00019534_114880 [Acytostelium subglobosum LB1]GAM28312.1 hypothetical protein SAMD00019534_114880 [Acytostelium subglobosum LB1]|eukprot:XP_012748629.1 hypothetical protein SAMD00019534_114880 [Acytostelium subglobosum LB1]
MNDDDDLPLLLLLSLLLLLLNNVDATTTNTPDNPYTIYQHLSTKTPYWIPPVGVNGTTDTPQPPPGCQLGRIDLLARHGSRNPVASNIASLETLSTTLQPYAANITEQYQWILNWTVPYPVDEAGLLILQGQYEHYNISKRFLQRQPGYFQPYQPFIYDLSATCVSRTGISGGSFMYGLFENVGQLGPQRFQPVFIDIQSCDQDNLLRFFDTCQSYNTLIDLGDINDNEVAKYNNLTFGTVSNNIATKLGLQNIMDPTNKLVSNMYQACSYDLSIFNITDRWCSLFSEEDILTLEYSQDLSNYWMKSYGYLNNYIIASSLFQDMISGLDQYIANPTANNATNAMRFAHAETVIPFVTLLGLYQDPFKLTANLTAQQISNRLWRSSIISPYAANIAFYLFNCGDDQYKIRVDHNEVGVLIPGCDDLYCNYTLFKSLFPEAMAFNWTTYCSPSSNNNGNSCNKSEDAYKIYLGTFIPVAFVVGTLAGALTIIFFKKNDQTKIPYRQVHS